MNAGGVSGKWMLRVVGGFGPQLGLAGVEEGVLVLRGKLELGFAGIALGHLVF